jgi:hypothetical protein
MGERAKKIILNEDEKDEDNDPERTGLYTSGVVATCAGHRVALFFSGRRHAGENLQQVLQERLPELEPPIQMCDALSRNYSEELQTILANCLAHGRRKFADIADRFKPECRYVIDVFATVYHNDSKAKKLSLSAEERLAYHQIHSKLAMDQLKDWLDRQITEKLVEPNSALGEAIQYLRNHWMPLTLFLRQAGAPLDNNICERALKKAIVHRKNSMFYKSRNGAQVGDIHMSLIYTCELNNVNAFDYLNQLHLHAAEVADYPERWMPWNYRDTMASLPDVELAVC